MLKGKPISDGIGIGKAKIVVKEETKIEKKEVKNIKEELNKFYSAIDQVKESTKNSMKNLQEQKQINIIEAYLMILEDNALIEETVNLISNKKLNGEYATEVGFNHIIEKFSQIDDEYMAERAADIRDIKNRILANLTGNKKVDLTNLEPNTIIIAKELTTSDTAKLDIKNVEGIISQIGGQNSHVSIIARTKEIPTVIRIQNILEEVKDGDTIIVNGKTGEVFINPSKGEIEKYQILKEKEKNKKDELKLYKEKRAKTEDGILLEVMANIGNTNDLEDVIKVGADGIGLFRTEFLFMDTNKMPTEEEQFRNYKLVAEKMKEKLSIIRTLDIGGDKQISYLNLEKEENPFLGYRAIRICLNDVDLFKTQLRAILRASAFGNLAIMFPMISSIEELKQAKEILEECKQELVNKKIEFDNNIKVGIMIEVPAAAIMSEELARECDFFSIGTNDLIQYTVAAERGNTKVAKLYTKNHPAVIRLIKKTIDSAHKAGILCGMCGEAASNILYIPILIGLGLDEFSMNSSAILQSKKVITNLNKEECVKLSQEVLQLKSNEEVEKKIIEFGKNHNIK